MSGYTWDHVETLATFCVPLPEPLPEIRRGPKPGYPWSCWDREPRIVWLVPADWHDRPSLRHEFGHCFADTYLTTRALRQRAARLCGHPGLRWFWGTWNPLRHIKQPNEENFADLYAQCAARPGGYPAFRKFLRDVKERADRAE